MFTGLYPLVSQDSFTLVSLTFKAGLLGNEQVQSSVHRLPTCLASKRRKTTKLPCVKELSGTPQKPDACRFHCRYRQGRNRNNQSQEVSSLCLWGGSEGPGLLTAGEAGGL